MKRTIAFVLISILCLIPCFSIAWAEDGQNLLVNGGFEQIDASGLPQGWYTDAYINQPGYTEYTVDEVAKEGKNAALVTNFGANDARFAQIVDVEPDTVYRLHGYVKTKDVSDSGMGANLSVGGVYVFSESIYGTQEDWKELSLYGRTGPDQTTIIVFARLGGYSGESDGQAYFDDISLTKVVGDLPPGALLTSWFKADVPQEADTQDEVDTQDVASPAWPVLILLSLAFVAAALLAIPYLQKEFPAARLKREQEQGVLAAVVLSLLAAFVLRVILAVKIYGYGVDIGCFLGWSGSMFSGGPVNFYTSGGFADYPPAYLFVLWVNGAIASWFGPLSQGMQLLNIKMVPILADIASAALLYRVGKKSLPAKAAAALAVLYAFNPAVIANGSAWGQVDSVLALGLLLVALFAMERRWDKALPMYMLCVLIKPQALMLGPLGLAALVMDLCRTEKKDRLWSRMGFGLLWSLVVAAIIIIPFSLNQSGTWPLGKLEWVYNLYKNTLGSYPFTTLNTANLYYVLSWNWEPVADTAARAIPLALMMITFALSLWQFSTVAKRKGNLLEKYGLPVFSAAAFLVFLSLSVMDVSYSALGASIMALTILWVLYAYVRGNNIDNLPLLGGILYTGLYVLGIKMHERYLFPALLLLGVAYIKKRDWRILLLLVGLSVTTFINTGIVLDNSIRLGSESGHLRDDTKVLNIIVSVLNLGLCAFAFYTGEVLGARNKPGTHLKRFLVKQGIIAESPAKSALLAPEGARLNLSRLDAAIMAGVTLLYAVLTFWNLGSLKAPQTTWVSTGPGEQVVLDLGAEKDFRMLYFGGINYNDFSVAVSPDGNVWSQEYSAQMQEGNCFQWQYVVETLGEEGSVAYTGTPRELNGRYVRLTAPQIGLNLNEVILRTADGQVLPLKVSAHTGNNIGSSLKKPAENLVDEQDTLEGEPGWFNGTYFDEIYHARTAFEHANNIRPYETSHPPLGKVMMSWAVMAFGMTPFGWRFAGALAGVLMLPVIYLLGKLLTRRTDLGAAAMLLMTFDLMHFTQTRIATIDSFPVLFIMVSYLCMFYYVKMDFWIKPFWKTLVPLALSGLFMGLAIASKWIGIYAGAGLAALFFWSCWRHYREAREASKLMGHKKAVPESRREASELAAQEGSSRILVTCLCCLVFFIAVPAIIYYLSYIPYFAPSGGVTIQKIIETQKDMFDYHSKPGLGADHPFQSPWWEWPLILKPMWFYKGMYVPEGTGSTIFCMGNPAVWWIGLVALIAVFSAFVMRHLWRSTSERIVHLHTREKDVTPALLLIGFASQYMPWVLVPRSTFIYHYFASVPFIILCTVLCFKWLRSIWKEGYAPILWTFVAISGILFFAFYPYTSGVVTSTAWLDFMKWFPKIYY